MANENNDDLNEPITDDQTVVDDGANPPASPSATIPVRSRHGVDFASMNDRERAFVQAARREEKDKLYKEQQRLKEDNDRLQRQLREIQAAPIPTTVAGADAQNDRIERLMQAVEQTNARLEAMQSNEIARRRESELRAYAANSISAMRERGEDVIEALVGGDSEDEVDESLLVARAEYQRVAIREEEKRNRTTGGRRSSVTVQANGGRPTGTPRPVAPNTVDADDNEPLSEITSDDAVRNGTYEKNRTQLLSKLKRGYKYTGNQPAQ